MKLKNLFIILTVLVIIAIVLLNLIIFYPSPQERNTIKIGAILPLSGPTSIWGESIKNGMEIAKQELALEGINIEIIYEDSKGDAKEGVSAYQNLRLKNVDIIVTALSRVSIPLISLSDEDKIPLIMTLTSAKAVSEQSPYAFRFYADEKGYADAHLDNFETGDYNTMGLLYLNDDYGVSVAEHIKNKVKEKHIQIIAEENYNPGTTDFRAELSKIKSENPEMIMFVDGAPIEAINIVKQYKELNIEIQLYEASTVLSYESTREQTPSEGIYTSVFPFFIDNIGLKFKERYKEEYNLEPSFGAPFGYDIVMLVGKATNGKKVNGKQIADNILNLKTIDSLNGELEIKPDGEINPILFSAKIVDGKLVRLE